jgi:hypothetical protein
MKRVTIFLCFIVLILSANFVLSQDNTQILAQVILEQDNLTEAKEMASLVLNESIAEAQEKAAKIREEKVMYALKWLLVFAIIVIILIIIGPLIFKKVRRYIRRLSLYILIFWTKRKKQDKQFIRDTLTYYGFKRKHVYDAVHRYEKRWGLKK